MSKDYFYDTRVHANGEITLHFKHDVSYSTRLKIAKRIQKKGNRKVSLYPDGRLEIYDLKKPIKEKQYYNNQLRRIQQS